MQIKWFLRQKPSESYFCKEAFAQKNSVNVHLKQHQQFASETLPGFNITVKYHILCGFCFLYGFWDHLQENPLQCQMYDEVFAQKNNMNVHVLKYCVFGILPMAHYSVILPVAHYSSILPVVHNSVILPVAHDSVCVILTTRWDIDD